MSIGTRIKSLIESKGMTQKEFAEKIGVSDQIVSDWIKGKKEPRRNMRDTIAKFFGIDPSELFIIKLRGEYEHVRRVPVISWVHANQFQPITDIFPPGEADDYVYTTIKGRNTFALRVQNDCMEPEFREGDIIIVEPGIDVASGDYVIIADRKSDKATFKQLKKYGDKVILHPLNSKYPDIELDHKKEYHIVGKVIEKVKKY